MNQCRINIALLEADRAVVERPVTLSIGFCPSGNCSYRCNRTPMSYIAKETKLYVRAHEKFFFLYRSTSSELLQFSESERALFSGTPPRRVVNACKAADYVKTGAKIGETLASE